MFGTVAIRIFCAALAAMAILAVARTAQAGVDISTKPTQNMSCSAGVCSPTAKKAVLNVNDVTTALAAGDLKVTTGSGAEDIHIDAPFSWTSTSQLTLDAQRSIEFKQPVTVAGVGGIALITNDGGTGGDYWFDPGASITFWDLSSSLVMNAVSFILVNTLSMLASDIAAAPGGSFALAKSYDASIDGTYTQSPVSTAFQGSFEGLGNKVSKLTIENSTQSNINLGLFAHLGNGGTIRDVLLDHATVKANTTQFTSVGILVGLNEGPLIAHCYASGTVRGGESVFIGGLIGSNGSLVASKSSYTDAMHTIANSGVSAKVSGGPDGWVGGLVGVNLGMVTQSFSHGEVRGIGGESTQGIFIGGLAAENDGLIDASYSSSRVAVQSGGSQGAEGGGLVGDSYGSITNSHATGAVVGRSQVQVGGLVGWAFGNRGGVQGSYATGAVTAGDSAWAGGLFGWAGSTVNTSFATGNVTSGKFSYAGGLAGTLFYNGYDEFGSVRGSYSTGSVNAGSDSKAGGLIGSKDGYASAKQAYSTGTVTVGARSLAGGLLGSNGRPGHPHIHLDSTYWDLNTSGIGDPAQGVGNIPNAQGVTGLADAQLKASPPDGFDPKLWGQNPNINSGYPYLLANPPAK